MAHAPCAPSPWLARFAHLLPHDGETLDLACGDGRHSLFLAARGHAVLALDRDVKKLAALQRQGLRTCEYDLEAEALAQVWPFPTEAFSAILVFNYLHRPLFPYLLTSLKPGGILLYETFTQGNEYFGAMRNPRFLLRSGELIRLVHLEPQIDMHILAYEEGRVETPAPAALQRICARRAHALHSGDWLSIPKSGLPGKPHMI